MTEDSADLHVKYRPSSLDDVVGHEAEVKSLSRLAKKGLPHTFLFAGPSGVGKTTLARVVGSMVDAQVIEVDAATYSGVNETRSLTEGLYYRSLTGSGNKCVILDEAHSLSKQSWQSLLKIVEEPPSHVYFCFCTTEVDKVPNTIKTRAHKYTLKELSQADILTMLERVAESEPGIKLKPEALKYIAKQSEGSARTALVYLSQAAGAKTTEEVQALVDQGAEQEEVVKLFRLLAGGGATWTKCVDLLGKTEVGSYESLRINLLNYMAAVVAKKRKPADAEAVVAVIDAFSRPFNRSTEKAEFFLALAECTLGDG